MMDEMELIPVVRQMVAELLESYEKQIPDSGEFRDLRVWRQVQFGDPGTALPGKLELVIMSMDARLDPKYQDLRFLAVRVMKSRAGGYASSTCLHGSKAELKSDLEKLLVKSDLLLSRIRELADGLTEETNPDIWR
jgi:hypothetical protein